MSDAGPPLDPEAKRALVDFSAHRADVSDAKRSVRAHLEQSLQLDFAAALRADRDLQGAARPEHVALRGAASSLKQWIAYHKYALALGIAIGASGVAVFEGTMQAARHDSGVEVPPAPEHARSMVPSSQAIDLHLPAADEPSDPRPLPTPTHSINSASSPQQGGHTTPTSIHSGGSSSEERHLLDSARVALAQGKLEDGLLKVSEHMQKYPQGELSEEREAIAVRLLVERRQVDEAEIRASRFRARYPRSLMWPAVQAALDAAKARDL